MRRADARTAEVANAVMACARRRADSHGAESLYECCPDHIDYVPSQRSHSASPPTASGAQCPLTAQHCGAVCILGAEAFTWNEMVVDTSSVEERLPETILAFFFVPGGDPGQARMLRDGFAREYGLVGDRAPPVVLLNLGEASAPFRLDVG